jgi:exonuclease SbcD
VDAKIATVLLVGNHDQHTQGQGGASLCIYRTLGVPGFVVGDRLQTHQLQTRQGPLQVITLPWLTHSTLLTRPAMESLSLSQVNHQLLDRLKIALEGEIRQLDPTLPTVLAAHAMLDGATFGAERFLAVGKGFTLPLSMVARDCFDYVALGHVHRHQVLCHHPPVVYAGSLERVDFSEETETKGYVLVDLAQGNTTFEFQPLTVRRFKTIKTTLTPPVKIPVTTPVKTPGTETEDLEATLLAAIEAAEIEGAIVRLIYQLTPDQLANLDEAPIHAALAKAHSYTLQAELITPNTTRRLPELGEGQTVSPLEALQTYLNNREDLQAMAGDLLMAAEALIQGPGENGEGGTDWVAVPFGTPSPGVRSAKGEYAVNSPLNNSPLNPDETQLRLL